MYTMLQKSISNCQSTLNVSRRIYFNRNREPPLLCNENKSLVMFLFTFEMNVEKIIPGLYLK